MAEQRRPSQRQIYLHTKQVSYEVPCPPCKVRGHRTSCRICEGTGKVPPDIADRLSADRDGEMKEGEGL